MRGSVDYTEAIKGKQETRVKGRIAEGVSKSVWYRSAWYEFCGRI